MFTKWDMDTLIEDLEWKVESTNIQLEGVQDETQGARMRRVVRQLEAVIQELRDIKKDIK